MDTKTLRHFIALANTLHFGRASEIVHLSPSALSRSIKQLEEELGASLFLRNNRTVSLTHQGELFFEYAKEQITQWEGIKNTLLTESQSFKGEISLYCSVTASYSFLYDILSDLRDQYPGIEIKLHTGDPDLAIQRVLNNEEDMAITARPDVLPKGCLFKAIGRSPLLFIRPKEPDRFDIPAHDSLSLEEWSNVPMILSEGGVSRKRVNDWFSDQNITPKIYTQVSGNEAIVSMVSLGFGMGVVPKIVLDNSPLKHTVDIINVMPELIDYEVGLVTKERKLSNPIMSAFWNM
jgi:LysR family positive regulator for ilvC